MLSCPVGSSFSPTPHLQVSILDLCSLMLISPELMTWTSTSFQFLTFVKSFTQQWVRANHCASTMGHTKAKYNSVSDVLRFSPVSIFIPAFMIEMQLHISICQMLQAALHNFTMSKPKRISFIHRICSVFFLNFHSIFIKPIFIKHMLYAWL